MKWDGEAVGANIALGGATATHSTSEWNSVLGDVFLSRGCYDVEIATDDVDNISCFVGVVSRQFWDEVRAAEPGEEVLPRDSAHAICMHGDGRVFIKGQEKDWGLMRVASGSPITITLDFERGQVAFRLARTVRGKAKETVAEIPGLFAEATLVASFGGRGQQLTIARCERRGADDDGADPPKRVRDIFTDVGERVAPVPFSAPGAAGTYEEQVRDIAATME